jgi:hypothetical protein
VLVPSQRWLTSAATGVICAVQLLDSMVEDLVENR